LLSRFPAGPAVSPRPSSWSTTNADIDAGAPFPLWKQPGNGLHDLQWEYVGHTIWLVESATHYAQTAEGRQLAGYAEKRLQPALHSCQFWWASRRPWWDVTMIERGMLLLQEAVLHAARALHVGDGPADIAATPEWRLGRL
jgi:hypothetical protein